jgi:DnaJ-class molecular chaperone
MSEEEETQFIVCPQCEGTGFSDKPSVNLATGRFREGTAHGSCPRCNGKGVIGWLVIDKSAGKFLGR